MMMQPMRRQDRALSVEEASAVLEQCDVCRLAFADNPVPYIVPMCFGMAQEEGQTILYFHCACEGRKLKLIQNNPSVGFEADRGHSLIRADRACGWGMAFESVIGEGLISLAKDAAEKRRGLSALMRHYGAEEERLFFPDEMLGRTVVLRLVITALSGKRRPIPVTEG